MNDVLLFQISLQKITLCKYKKRKQNQMVKQQTDFIVKIIIIILIIWLLKDLLTESSCSIKSNFFVPQVDRDLMKKNTVYIYVRNPFLDDLSKDLDIETLRNIDDPTDRTNFSYVLTTYYNLQNQHFHLIDDINNVIKQLRNLYKIDDIEFHSSATDVIDFSDQIAYTQILNELSSTSIANTKSTFASTYDANIAANVSTSGSSNQTINPKSIGTIKFNYDPNVAANMLIINKGSLLTASEKSYLRIRSVTRNKPSSNMVIANETMTLEIENPTDSFVTFNVLGFYQIIRRIGPPVPTLTKFLYDQTIREDEIVVVFNNKMTTFTMSSFDPNIYLINYFKNKPLDFEAPPYTNFRREQLMQLFYKNHF